MELEEKARIFAKAAHSAANHLRKYTNEPYITHPEEVVGLLKTLDHTKEMLAAAWLHDVVEDTGVSLSLIREEFGSEVAELVYWLTDVSRPEMGSRAQRKAIDRRHLAAAPAAAQTVKLMDLISNTRSIVVNDPTFAKVYLVEKWALLGAMTLADPKARDMARATLLEADELMNTLGV
jgi:(p)ppGpp synthase/HD superfamily hydrolase